jgi:glycosyltransferase involved in cell wall biosynthesis
MNKKRVLIFSTAYFPFIGGAEVAVKEIANRIKDVDFVMVTSRLDKNLPNQEKIGNIEVHRIGKGDKWDKVRLVLNGAKFAQKLGSFDVVWSVMASYSGFAALNYKKKNTNVKFLLTLQEGDTKEHIYKRVWFVWPIFKQIFKRADKIQAISSYLANWARQMGAKCPVEVVPNGVDLEVFSKIEDKGVEDVSSGSSKKTIITVSRLVEKNGIECLIRSMQFLPENITLKIIGEGELESQLKSLAENKKLNNRIEFLGKIDPAGVSAYLKESDVFCRPSISEGLGNAFLEAMAMNVPVVATPVGGIPDFLEDGKTGWYAQVKDAKSIAEKIKYILDNKNKEKVEKVVRTARKMVEEKYNWDTIAKKMREMM